jgi:catechol 2,3-dioxygenase-like lactoylglutathione lyase family enzyme
MLHHVTHEVLPAQLEPCIAFYEVLGFRPVPAPEGIAERAVWLESGPTQIHLLHGEGRDRAHPPTAKEPGTGDSPTGSGHVAVVVDRYEATAERLESEGHAVEPRRPHWGSPRSYVRDPAGYLVELMAWPPGGG